MPLFFPEESAMHIVTRGGTVGKASHVLTPSLTWQSTTFGKEQDEKPVNGHSEEGEPIMPTRHQRGSDTRTELERLGRAFCAGLIVVAIASNAVRAEAPKTSRLTEVNTVQEGAASNGDAPTLRFQSIEPTVFFVKEKGNLLQMVEVVVENTSGPAEAGLDIKLGSQETSTDLGKVKEGKAAFQVHVPDIDDPTPVEFALKAGGKLQDRRKMTWQPQRHWKVYFVPITHHDLGYTDTIENVLHKYDGFYDDIARFCEETDDWPEESKYRYTVEQTWSIQHFLEEGHREKEVVEKLGKYIKEGRIEIPAFFGNEISTLCSHEELIRLMYPSFRLKRKYGVPIRTGAITDVPGMSWGLPTVLAGAGVKYFFAGLPTYFRWGGRTDIHTFWDEAAILRHGRPDAFRWQGPDGGSVLVYYQGSYGFFTGGAGPNSSQEIMDHLPGKLNAMEKQDSPFDVVRYIHNGVDNYPPGVNVSHIVREWNNRWAYPKLVVATNTMFFEALEKQCQDVRTFRGELPHTDYAVGAIGTAKETAINRITHDRLHSAEKFATVAINYPRPPFGNWIGTYSHYQDPFKKIGEAYDNMLLYDEHTWGMSHQVGKLQDWSWNDKSGYAYRAGALAESVLLGSLDTVTGAIELKEKGRHIVVFNSLSFQRTDVVKVPSRCCGYSGFIDFSEKPFDLIDEETGEKVPHQIVELDSPQAPVPYAAPRYCRGQFSQPELFELVFVAEGVPSLGYKTYRLLPKEKAGSFPSGVVVGENSLENRFFRVTLDPQTGTIESIHDKELAREIVDQGAPHKLNQFVARWVKSGKEESPKKATTHKGQSGPVYGSLVVSTQGAGCPQLTQEIILYDKIKRIDLANRILKDSTPLVEIYFAFPFKIDNPEFRFEGSCSVIKPLRDQFPGSNSNYYAVQHWADVSDGQIGVTLSPVESHLLEFGGLWPCYVSQAHHGVTPPDFGRPFVKAEELTNGHMYSFVLDSNFRTNFPPTQQGDLLFRYSITTHQGDWKKGRPRDFGWAIGNPLMPVSASGKKEGMLGRTMSFCQVDKPNVLLLTLKQAEDGDGIILRLVETEGEPVAATVTLPHLTIKKAYRTNLVEENKGELTFTPHEVSAPVKAFGITTIRLQAPR